MFSGKLGAAALVLVALAGCGSSASSDPVLSSLRSPAGFTDGDCPGPFSNYEVRCFFSVSDYVNVGVGFDDLSSQVSQLGLQAEKEPLCYVVPGPDGTDQRSCIVTYHGSRRYSVTSFPGPRPGVNSDLVVMTPKEE